MNFTEKDLEQLLKKAKAGPSHEWHQAALNNLRLLAGKDDVTIQDEPRISLWHVFFNPTVMKKALSIMVALVLVVGAGLYYTSPGAAFARHMSRAQSALGELKAYTKGESPSTRQSFLPTAYAEDTTTAEESAVVDLVLTVESETDASIEAVEGFDDLASTQEALDSLDALQDETVEVLGEVVITTESEVVVEIATEVIADTAEENTSVEEAITATEEAEAAGEETVELEIALAADAGDDDEDETSNRETKTQERLSAVAELMASIDPASNPAVEFTASMQEKFEAIQEIVAACNDEDPDNSCNSGKAKGLATALSAKVRNELRAAAANESEDQDEEDAEDEDGADENDENDESDEDDAGEEPEEGDDSDEGETSNNQGEDNASLRGENSAGASANGIEVSTDAKLKADFGLEVAAEKNNRADDENVDDDEESDED